MDPIDRYTWRVAWSPEDGEYAATCLEFPALSWLDSSPQRALDGIRQLTADCVRDLRANGEAVPEPMSTRRYSGRFVVRVPPALHRELSVQAAEAGVSLNRYVTHKLGR